MWVDGEWDENHISVVEFADNIVTMNEWGGLAGWLVHPSKFSSFVALKVVVCIGSDSVKDVFSVHEFGRMW